MTGITQQGSWLDGAASIVALPGEATAVTDELRRLLVSGSANQIIWEAAPRDRIGEWVNLLAAHPSREAFLLFSYSPAQVLRAFPPEIGESVRWSTLVELYEAWSEAASAGSLGFLDERSRRLGGAYLARTRWLLLSLPFRSGWEDRISPLDLGRINDGSVRIVTLARQARGNWLEVLGQIDDYPQLKADIAIEADAQDVAVLRIARERLRETSPDLNVPPRGPGDDPERDFAGDEVDRYVIARLLLPRFALGPVWRIVYGSAGQGARAAGGAAIAVFALTLAALVFGLADQHSGVLAWVPFAAAAWYAVIAITGAVSPPTAWPWLMRQPASAAVGLLALAIAPPDWWDASGREWHTALWAAVLLAAVGVGYLYFEAASQDVRGWSRAWRPLLVAAVGYLHAVMVSVIALRLLLPEFAPRAVSGPQLSCWWQASGCGPDALPSWLIVLAAASWSFAAAVFLQIIWDDQPVTAPLAHASWHRKD